MYFNNYLVKLELAKRAWQQADLAREARLSEPTVRAVIRGRRVSAATALKVVQALERTQWNQTRAAGLLGLNRDQIRYRIEKFHLEKAATH